MELIWESFGWSVKVVDGHNVGSLVDALAVRENRPTVVIANTVKGKGISFMENNPTWHHNRLTDDQYRAALSEIG
jgi:transketolase